LTNAALVNRHFASIEELEDAQLAQCAALQLRPDLIRQGDLLPLVAQADPQATRTQAKVVSAPPGCRAP
jgi:hypothetical protein